MNNATSADESNLAARGGFIALKTEVGELYFHSLFNVPTGLTNLKTKVDNLHVISLKIVTVNLKQLI